VEQAPNIIILDDNIIYLNGAIDPPTAQEVFSFVTTLNLKDDKPDNIIVLINSHGGCMDSTMNMVGAFRASDITITTVATGVCMSGGLMLAMAGDVRYVDEYCNVMSHTLSTESPENAKHADLQIWLDNVKLHTKKMVMHYMEHTGLDKQTVKKQLLPKNGEVYLTAKEAIEFNLFDDFFTSYAQFK
jgi:ATP-dependent protease ClpP protease subunit